ncbi:diguanylate cyclase [Alishewanella sp. BS5-314]|nr:diguanylate cyclase [Alishewanella sp. BS5-314]
MLKPALFFLLLLCLSFSFNTQADNPPPGTDPVLEAQLDQYLAQQSFDADVAVRQIQAILSSMNEQTPLETRVRAQTYLLFNFLYQRQEPQTQQALDDLLAIKQQQPGANALAEIIAAELEVHIQRNQLNEAYLLADSLSELLADARNPRVLYWVHALLGRLYRIDGQYDKALVHYDAALVALMTTNDERTLTRRSYLNLQIALVHSELQNWQRARQLMEELVSEAKQQNQTQILPDLYLSLGYVLAGQKDYTAAEAINKQGLEGARQQNNQLLALTFLNNLGSIYIEHKDYPSARQVLTQALTEVLPLNDPDNEQIIRFNLGYIKAIQDDAEQGLAEMHQAFSYYQQKGNKAEIEGYLTWFANAYRELKDYQKLADTLEWQLRLREEIMSEKREKSISDLQTRYDMKAQTQRITILQQQNELQQQLLENKQLQQRITLLFILLMSLAAVMLVQLYRKVRRSNLRLREMNKQLEYQSIRDPLTGLFNRRAMQEKMAKRHQEPQAEHCSLLLLDIDFFKHINDHYGHAAGDAVLVEISKRLSALCQENELVIRWGGEEFLLVLQRPQQTAIDSLCQTLLRKVSELPVEFEGKTIPVTISGGFINLPFAGVPEHQFNWERVLQVADMALYLSKVNGRNQINLVTGLRVPFSEAEPHLQSDLSGAIREQMIHYHTIAG